MTTLLDLIVNVAYTSLEFKDFISSQQYAGTSSGFNTTASNYFQSTMKLEGTDPDKLRAAVRGLVGPLGDFVAHVATGSIFNSFDRSSVLMIRYGAVLGLTNTQYLSNLGRYNDDLLYAPLAKYLAMKKGSGPRPACIPPSSSPFREITFAAGDVKLVRDGKDLLLLQHDLPGPVTVEPEAGDCIFEYTQVHRLPRFSNVDHVDNEIDNFTMTVNGILGPLTSSGIINTRVGISTAGKQSPTLLRFVGDSRDPAEDRRWVGFYGPNQFDGIVYTAAFSKLLVMCSQTPNYDPVTLIWAGAIGADQNLNDNGKGLLSAFTCPQIFSANCTNQVGLDANYLRGKAAAGKRRFAELYSGLYAIFLIEHVINYFAQF